MTWILAIIAVAVVVLLVESRRPHVVSPQRFHDTLVRLIQKQIAGEEWDRFVRIPIGSDAYLESLRQRLLALETKENLVGAEEGALCNPSTMRQVAAMLQELRSKVPIKVPEPTSGLVPGRGSS